MTGSNQRGNILFIILIAVALFAALSFAISQSTGQSGQSASRETSQINSAYLHQYPVSIRQAIVRMRLSQNLTIDQISFANLIDTTYGTFATNPAREVFHPQGGGVVYQAPPEGINDGSNWIFNGSIEVENVGSTSGNANSAELIAFLPGVNEEICRAANRGYDGAQTSSPPPSVTVAGENTAFTGTFAYNGTISDPDLDGKDAYCYFSTTLGQFVYYHVLVER
jgi:hypothetical protein